MKTKKYVYRVMSNLSIADTGHRYDTRKEAQAAADAIKKHFEPMVRNQSLRVERINK